jgi:2'-hydroxyisoflavone reductase
VKLLVLGGTQFLGRGVVEAALERGHDLTLFNRGRTNPELFPEVERLRGDRDGDLDALSGRSWDAVIDPSGFVPRMVRASVELLAPAVRHYTFVSSLSVYQPALQPGFDESAPVLGLDDPATEEVMANYGGLKAACEEVVESIFRDCSANVRAGLIVGPHDPTDRFTYWPVRIARGGDVLAPGNPDRPVQFVDARDLGPWLVHLGEQGTSATFNATGPVPPITFGELLEECRAVSGADAHITWVGESFLLERGVGEWMELPLWVAESNEESAHIHAADVSRAVAAGLRSRPVADTIRDTLEWAASRDHRGAGTVAMGGTEGVGMAPEREAELLAEWHQSTHQSRPRASSKGPGSR